MIRRYNIWISAISVISLLMVLVGANTSVVGAASTVQQRAVCQGSELAFADNPTDCTAATATAQSDVNKLVAQVINVFSIIVGIVAVIMIIFGGFKYVTAGGDSGSISSAKTTILFAIVGLVIVAMAQIIVKFVLAKATGVVSV